jgi:hypothetical protein
LYFPVVRESGNAIQTAPRTAYAPTYYPNASALANARRIVLKADQSNLRLDFRLVRAPVVSVRGSMTESNHPVSSIVTLRLAGDAAGTPRYSARSDDLGSFEIKNVAPGSYVATAEALVGKELIKASRHIVVYDRDENSVGLLLSPGVQISGRIAAATIIGAYVGTEVTIVPNTRGTIQLPLIPEIR